MWVSLLALHKICKVQTPNSWAQSAVKPTRAWSMNKNWCPCRCKADSTKLIIPTLQLLNTLVISNWPKNPCTLTVLSVFYVFLAAWGANMFSLFHYLVLIPQHTTQTTENKTNTTLTIGERDIRKYPAQWHPPSTWRPPFSAAAFTVAGIGPVNFNYWDLDPAYPEATRDTGAGSQCEDNVKTRMLPQN